MAVPPLKPIPPRKPVVTGTVKSIVPSESIVPFWIWPAKSGLLQFPEKENPELVKSNCTLVSDSPSRLMFVSAGSM